MASRYLKKEKTHNLFAVYRLLSRTHSERVTAGCAGLFRPSGVNSPLNDFQKNLHHVYENRFRCLMPDSCNLPSTLRLRASELVCLFCVYAPTSFASMVCSMMQCTIYSDTAEYTKYSTYSAVNRMYSLYKYI